MKLVPRTAILLSLLLGFGAALAACHPKEVHAAGTLQQAEELEDKGRDLIENGHRPEGARTMAEAWTLRAKLWEEEEKKAQEATAARAAAKPHGDEIAAGQAVADSPEEVEHLRAELAELREAVDRLRGEIEARKAKR